MRHKYKKHHKVGKKNISEKDQKILYLLNIQLQAIMIYLTADVFFYNLNQHVAINQTISPMKMYF